MLKHHSKDMEEIEKMIQDLHPHVINHGWTSTSTLKQFWARSHIWLYPCVFPETFAVTALEAACSQTLVVTNNNAGLQNSVGNRGIVLHGDPRTEEWQNQCINMLRQVLDTPIEQTLIDRNYEWAKSRSFDSVAKDFISRFL